MIRKILKFIILIFYSQLLSAQIINKIPLSERVTGYKIDVKLDTETKILSGTMDAFWVNKSADAVPEIRMHLYMNAFRSNQTTMFRELGGSPGMNESEIGWIELKSFTDRNNVDLLPSLKFISPDDGNPEDKTVVSVKLPEPVKPGDTAFIHVNFETKLPVDGRRTGYADDFYFIAQWFPKFGVYEPAGMRFATSGGWNCHQFHANSEFYSNHSLYEVNIDIPDKFIFGSGGLLISETPADNGRKIYSVRAEDIVDFAWTAWPGYAVINDRWKNVDITLLMPGDRISQSGRQLEAVKHALEYLGENVGPYPWNHLTFVDPPLKGAFAGGMEYTTLFTSVSSLAIPGWLHFPELVTVHEFGHAYFMGILASNEFEEPWLDEGINSFWEQRILDHYYGKESGFIDHQLLKVPDAVYSRLLYILSPSRQAVSNAEYSWNYPHGTYGMMSYQKTTVWMGTLMGIIGEETMNDIFREYYRKWAFKHPSGKDFINVVNEVVKREHGETFGSDMNWFFDQTLYGTGICDYKVTGIFISKQYDIEDKGFTDNSIDSVDIAANPGFISEAHLERAGEVKLPVEVLIHFDDGTEIMEKWDGISRYKDFTYTGQRKIEWVKIDPDFKIRMDVNFINNSKTFQPDRIPVRRLVNKFISFMQFYLSIVLL